ncbi:MAG TPA: outer membrane beta-barrel protein [Devosia sp.]|nr:outer membrane beta-barrel protein [Devosia sp.]
MLPDLLWRTCRPEENAALLWHNRFQFVTGLMRTSVLSLLVSAAIFGAPVSALAQDLGNPYLKVYGGVTAPNSLAWGETTYPLEPGWLVGGAIGLEVIPGLSVELDATFSAALYVGETLTHDAATLFANLVYSLPIDDAFSAYFGAGVGVVGIRYDTESAATLGGQVFAGLGYEVADNVTLFGEARYQTAFSRLTLWDESVEHNRASLLLGLKFGF